MHAVHLFQEYAHCGRNEACTPQCSPGVGVAPRTEGILIVLGQGIESFLRGEVEREKRRTTPLSLGGFPSRKEGDEFRRIAKALRESWR